jgi:hypothetical protein
MVWATLRINIKNTFLYLIYNMWIKQTMKCLRRDQKVVLFNMVITARHQKKRKPFLDKLIKYQILRMNSTTLTLVEFSLVLVKIKSVN